MLCYSQVVGFSSLLAWGIIQTKLDGMNTGSYTICWQINSNKNIQNKTNKQKKAIKFSRGDHVSFVLLMQSLPPAPAFSKKYKSFVTLQGSVTFSPVSVHIWLVKCYQSHLSSVSCIVFGFPKEEEGNPSLTNRLKMIPVTFVKNPMLFPFDCLHFSEISVDYIVVGLFMNSLF